MRTKTPLIIGDMRPKYIKICNNVALGRDDHENLLTALLLALVFLKIFFLGENNIPLSD